MGENSYGKQDICIKHALIFAVYKGLWSIIFQVL